MSQLTFKFPFKTSYFEKDFYVSSNNFAVYKLIESWPNWPDKWVNIYGPTGSGKTHLSNILKKKMNSAYLESSTIKKDLISEMENYNCIIIDNYNKNIEEKTLYSILNHSKQLDKFVVINSYKPISEIKVSLKDLHSRLKSFITFGIDLPTDELLRVILTKSFSDKQIEINSKILEYILKNIERSYEKVFKFVKDIDNESLSSGKSININLIKKVLNQ
ncbi:MAG: hypothetical protein CNC06_02030 [Pelagibacterales bacterium MED-G40]|nr:MAG: hypothetical protein CNC06_02030 [Pelagibacterales bacterium MED-G40]|tara:strand:+ start:3334 stop:3987 length:654 start_codon:yes stop_codon:yes gene_type:complete